ncbi:MAG TPA: SGNH/GDSL hydrolase family protein [Candidatus Limnocylindrales bacterium]|nr:SGNH/GDSL hydrolase family protein [Candidatus Limnocylindrales bacterium]
MGSSGVRGRPRGRAWFPLLALLGASVIPYLLAEGIYALSKGSQAETSLAWSFYATRFVARRQLEPDPRDPLTVTITDLSQIEPMLEAMKANGVGVGNSPFSELKTPEASINDESGECRRQKPNLRKKVGFLRTNLFNPFDQMTFFYDADRKLPPELEAFFARYAFRTVLHTTNEHGERVTLPPVQSPRKVLVAGDSVANGIMLEDSETLASQLQSADRARQYVNLGISRAAADDIACAMDGAAERYRGSLEELLYVFCENDFDPEARYGTPEDLIAYLRDYVRRTGIARVTFLYMPYIYNSVPEVTRLRGHLQFDFPTYHDEKRRLLALAAQEGFTVVDYLDVTNEERQRAQSQFAPLALYVDQTHMSRDGVARVVPRLLGRGSATAARGGGIGG